MQTSSTISQLLLAAQQQLTPAYPSARLEAEILLSHTLGRPRTWLRAWPEHILSAKAIDLFNSLVEQRLNGTPIAYLTGQKEFWSLNLEVSPDTLIPRPETELLVELALARIPPDAHFDILDLGTGSGAIALALAAERKHCRIIATDISTHALQIAHRNAQKHQLSNITFIESSWFEKLGDCRFDIIVANPPYLADDDPHRHEGDLRFEPKTALVGGATGMEALETIAIQSLKYLRANGWILFEHGYNQGQLCIALLQRLGYINIENQEDLAQKARVTLGKRPAS